MTLSWRSFLLLRKMLKMGTKKFGIFLKSKKLLQLNVIFYFLIRINYLIIY